MRSRARKDLSDSGCKQQLSVDGVTFLFHLSAIDDKKGTSKHVNLHVNGRMGGEDWNRFVAVL